MQSISLKELTEKVGQVIHQSFSLPVWIRAEISELRENRGHCYLELIEKDEASDNLLAKSRAIIWANTYGMLKPYFESQTGETLRAGLQVMVSVVVEFNGVYGFSLNIRDIDPVFTIGELAARRLEIIRQLERDGVVDMNKQLEIPELPQRVAVISSATAAGYEDFCNQLGSNANGYVFYHKLFPAVMQGAATEASVIAALDKIYKYAEFFDVVVIIRGGGATTDLSAFDSYNLALNCAQYPLPIIAGIGHQRDSSILDIVAHTSVKTPTAAAEFLIGMMSEADERLNYVVDNIKDFVKYRIREEEQGLEQIKMQLKHAARKGYYELNNQLSKSIYRLNQVFSKRILQEENNLQLIERKIETLSPQYMLKRGFTITTKNGKRINSKTELKTGDLMKTHFVDGTVESEVKDS